MTSSTLRNKYLSVFWLVIEYYYSVVGPKESDSPTTASYQMLSIFTPI